MTDTQSDPKPQDPKTPDPKPQDAKKAEAPEWTPKVGAACAAVYQRGGPEFVETGGKILKLHDRGTSADVEFTGPRGVRQTLERVPLLERGQVYASAGFLPPRG